MRTKSAFTMIEVLVALGMVSVVVASVVPIVSWLVTRSRYVSYDVAASLLLQEGMEVSYNVLVSSWDADWSQYPAGVYHPLVNVAADPQVWVLLPGGQTDLQTRFNREVSIDPICRKNDTGERVVFPCPPGSTVDNRTKVVTTTVKWQEVEKQRSISSELLVTQLTQ